MRTGETGRTASEIRHAQRPYFDPERPNVTEEVRAAIEQMAADGAPLRTDENGVPNLSTNALAFLWYSTASGSEAQWIDADDWRDALNGMYGAEHHNSPYLGYVVSRDARGYPCLSYDAGWSTVLAILQRTEIRGLAKHAACYQWVVGLGGVEVPYDLRAAYARLFLPPYKGPSLTLYRGCIEGHAFTDGTERHLSWTTSKAIARDFALSSRSRFTHVVRTHAPAKAIICDTREFMRKGGEDEIVVDPKMLREIEIVATMTRIADADHTPLRPSMPRRNRNLAPYEHLRVRFLKWGQKLREQDAEIPITASPPEMERLGRLLRHHSIPAYLAALHEAEASKSEEQRDWERSCRGLTRKQRESQWKIKQEEREVLDRMQALAERGMTLEEIAVEAGLDPWVKTYFGAEAATDLDPWMLAEHLSDIVGEKGYTDLQSAIEVWLGE